MAVSGDDRRRHPRIRLEGRAAGRATILAEFTVIVLSEKGATLEMDLPLALGSTCDLVLALDHGEVELKGRVVHVQASPESPGRFQVGVDFTSVDELDRGLLLSFLDRRAGKQA